MVSQPFHMHKCRALLTQQGCHKIKTNATVSPPNEQVEPVAL